MTRRTGRSFPRPHRGFTLIEVLAASAITAVLIGSLYASLHIAFAARDTAINSIATARRLNTTIELIKADLESAVVPNPAWVNAPLNTLAGPFQGQSSDNELSSAIGNDVLAFYSTVSDAQAADGVGEIKLIEYRIEPDADSKESCLVRHVTGNLLSPDVPATTAEVLCRRVKTFTLQYYDPSNTQQPWQTSWDSTAGNSAGTMNTLPQAVWITLELEDDSTSSGGVGPQMSRVVNLPCAPAATTGTGLQGLGGGLGS